MSRVTTVFILQKTDPKEVFDFCNSLMGAENPRVKNTSNERGYISYANEWDQGLPALMSVLAHEERDVNPEAYYDELYEEDFIDCDDPEPRMMEPACAISLSFDTTYGYRDEFGGVDNLHGRYIIALHDWLAEKGISLKWKEEYTGDIHDGLNNIDRMIGNEKSSVFYNEIFMPTVVKHIQRETR